jgi:hypothetical protein
MFPLPVAIPDQSMTSSFRGVLLVFIELKKGEAIESWPLKLGII